MQFERTQTTSFAIGGGVQEPTNAHSLEGGKSFHFAARKIMGTWTPTAAANWILTITIMSRK